MPTQSEELAFGVDPTRKERFSLRQARYRAIEDTILTYLRTRHTAARPLKVLDVGVDTGVSLRHLEGIAGEEAIEFVGVDIRFHPNLYHRDRWTLLQGDLTAGLQFIPDESFDAVICEQVLEHLPDVTVPLQTIARVVRPGGIAVLGVPIYPAGLCLLRRHLVPLLDRLTRRSKARGHIQAWTKKSFIDDIKRNTGLAIECARGFRIVSGGPLRKLENYEWWWKLNRSAGRFVPSICTEIQVVASKPTRPM
jgi:SAM-dependent methyltransferase